MKEYKVIIHAAEEGGYWAEIPELPGCFSQGETLDEIKENIRESALAWMQGALSLAFSRPIPCRRRQSAAKRELVCA